MEVPDGISSEAMAFIRGGIELNRIKSIVEGG
jgi:hypothetical protein